jgi:1,2-phenylacetyl-CoA epoxidase PaaB subunit
MPGRTGVSGISRSIGGPAGDAMPRWRVDYFGKKKQHLGAMEAANEKQAIEVAESNMRSRPRHV